ncbi:acyl-CoA thioesterase [Olleya namhaensis]|uniref:acyl-CoA thioesterase n=1 Tax=Olleya namhaensis TaxID=1144750 RepID=UPI00232C2DEC|nr:thioesterase family protein [Olleya namhaensis]
MKSYSQTLTVTPNDLDELNHVNNVKYIEWVNQVAKAHWVTHATKQILDQYFWVLILHHIDYKQEIVLGQTVILNTYVKSCQGVTSIRVVEILVDEKICAYSETKWCLIHTENNKPARITPEIITLFQ